MWRGEGGGTILSLGNRSKRSCSAPGSRRGFPVSGLGTRHPLTCGRRGPFLGARHAASRVVRLWGTRAACATFGTFHPLSVMNHAANAAVFTKDDVRTHWHDQALWFVRAKRD